MYLDSSITFVLFKQKFTFSSKWRGKCSLYHPRAVPMPIKYTSSFQGDFWLLVIICSQYNAEVSGADIVTLPLLDAETHGKESLLLDLKPGPWCPAQPTVQRHWTQIAEQTACLSTAAGTGGSIYDLPLPFTESCSCLRLQPNPTGPSPGNEMFRIWRSLESYAKMLRLLF